MRTGMIRQGLMAAMILGAVILLGLAALPVIASTQIVKDHIALELNRWSGYRVTLGGSPVIRVWPKMQAVLSDVRFSEWGSNGGPAVLVSDIVEIDLSAFAALRGRIEPQRVHFVRPVLRLRMEDGHYRLPRTTAGRFHYAVSIAERHLMESPGDTTGLPAEPVGGIDLTEGRIVARGRGDEPDVELLSSITAKLGWPTMNRELTFKAGSIWRGENISLSGTMAAPLALLAGHETALRVNFESAPLTGSFAGTISPLQMSGEAAVATPSLGRALEWLDVATSDRMPSGAVSATGTLVGNLRQMKLDTVRLTLGSSTGVGTMEYAMRGPMPAISGTLAFENLDLVQLLTAYSVLPADMSDSQLADLLRLDLRLSALRATAGPFSLANVAAVIKLDDQLVTFDISDSQALGGSVIAGIRIDRKPANESAEFRLLADGIDGAALSDATGSNPWIPNARSKLSVILKGPLTLPDSFVSQANGSITASFESGTVGSFDLASFLDRAASGGFFAMDDLAPGTISFDRAEAKFTMTDGVARIDKAAISAGGRLIELGGIADYGQSSIAVTGRVQPGPDEDADVRATSFFAGGSWHSPYFSAILSGRPESAE